MTTLKLSAEFCFQFQDIDDLRLLGNNAEMINTLEIPLCTILRLKDKLNNLCEGNIPFPVVDTCTFTKIRYPGYKLLAWSICLNLGILCTVHCN